MDIKIKDTMEIYEEQFFANDEPVPFVGDLYIYPAIVKDYYNFYNLISCFTMDKNEAPDGIGLSMNDLGYVAYLIKEDVSLTFQDRFFKLLSMVFHMDNGLYCDNEQCEHKGEIVKYSDIRKQVAMIDLELSHKYEEQDKEQRQAERQERMFQLQICPHCNRIMRDVFEMKEENKKAVLYIKGFPIKSKDYKNLRRIYCYQNIMDYDDEYIDPELKKGLEEAARLRSGNVQQPTLERQKACIVASTGLNFAEVDNLTLRKFTLLLRVVDSKLSYLAYKIGELSGLVTFKTPFPHWIYQNDKAKDHKFDHIMTIEQIESKIGNGNKIE